MVIEACHNLLYSMSIQRFYLLHEQAGLVGHDDDVAAAVAGGGGPAHQAGFFHPIDQSSDVGTIYEHHITDLGLAKAGFRVGLMLEQHQNVELNIGQAEGAEKIVGLFLT